VEELQVFAGGEPLFVRFEKCSRWSREDGGTSLSSE